MTVGETTSIGTGNAVKAVAREQAVFYRDRSIRFDRLEEFIMVAARRSERSMKRNSERKFMNVAIRHGSVRVLALGLVVGLATVRAASDDSAPISPGEQHQMAVTSVVDEQDVVDAALTSEASITGVVAASLTACCIPTTSTSRTRGSARDVCVASMNTADCLAAGGVPVRSCLRMCASYMAPAGTEDAGDAVEDTGASDSSPADGQTASAWTLLIAALFLAGL
jgi:hypothetical protein